MRKDREKRYATAAEFAQDITNYLDHRPLIAGPESKLYRLRKFIRRRRGQVIAASLVAASLLVGIVGTTTFALRAQRRAQETRQVADFQARMLSDLDVQAMGLSLRQDVLDEAEQNWRSSNLEQPEIARRRAELEELLAGANFTNPAIRGLRRDIIDRALKTIDEQFTSQPLVKARLLQNLADTLRGLTLLEPATAPQTEALDLRARLLGRDDPDVLASTASMGLLLAAKGKWAQAEPYARRALDGRRRVLGDDHPETLRSKSSLADALQRQGRLADAEVLREDVMQAHMRTLPQDDPLTLDAMLKYGQVLMWRYKLDAADSPIERAIAGLSRVYGGDDWRPRKAMGIQGNLRRLQGKFPEAETLFKHAYEGTRASHGDHHRDTMFLVLRIGQVLRLQGKLTESEPYLDRAVKAYRQVVGDEHWDTLEAVRELGLLRQSQGKLGDAESLLEQALSGLRLVRGDEDEYTLVALLNLGVLQQELGEWDSAELHLAELYEKASRAPIEPVIAARFMSWYGPCLVKRGNHGQAETPLREAYRRLNQTGQVAHPRMRAVVWNLAQVCDHTNRAADAAQWRAELARLPAAIQPATATLDTAQRAQETPESNAQ
jgi:tetratricopeptide (TPR) repeat protein